MSIDNDRQEEFGDARVSSAYRDLGRPASPEHLDALVMQRATASVRSPLGNLMAWSRPLAWAATIAVCLAVVLELQRGPEPDGILPEVSEVGAVASDGALSREAPAPALRSAEMQPSSAAPSVPALAEEERSAAAPVVESKRQEQFAQPAARRPTLADAPPREFDSTVGESADNARAVTVDEPAQDAAAAGVAAQATIEAFAEPSCDPEARKEPDAWLSCIERLEQQGATAAAERERDSFAEAFPEFLPR